MIHGTEPALQASSWQEELRQAFRHPRELLHFLNIEPESLESTLLPNSTFPMRVPRSYAQRMEKGNPRDPLLRQVLPVATEKIGAAGFVNDPVADLSHNPVPGLLHKYRGRALLITTGACAVNCRFCFRRHFPYADHSTMGDNWGKLAEYLTVSEDIEEVILSGGDPLMLSDDQLARLIGRLSLFSHLQRVRLHTRVPVVLPERITQDLLRTLSNTRLQTIMVLHANHARELLPSPVNRFRELGQNGIVLLNQSVLLRGVNDSTDALCTLSDALLSLSVLPYYLHLLDRVDGAAHFEVPESKALTIHREMTARMPGYLVPKLVRENTGWPSKTLVV